MTKCLILTEAGEGIGYGHLTRCSAIFDALNKNNIHTKMFLNVKGSIDISENIQKIDWLLNPQKVIDLKSSVNCVIIDSYIADMSFYSFINKHFKTVIAIDDYNRINYPCPYILNPNIYGNKINYQLQKHQQLFAGSEYVILRKEFRKNSADFKVHNEIQNILITVGGHDIRSLIPLLLDNLSHHYNIKAIAGSANYQKELSEKFTSSNIHFEGFADASKMKELMLWSDLAFSTCGQTLHELAYSGIPTIGICIDNDQELNTELYAEIGFLQEVLIWNDKEIIKKLLSALNNYQSQSVRFEKSRIGKQFIDGNGVRNISELIISL